MRGAPPLAGRRTFERGDRRRAGRLGPSAVAACSARNLLRKQNSHEENTEGSRIISEGLTHGRSRGETGGVQGNWVRAPWRRARDGRASCEKETLVV